MAVFRAKMRSIGGSPAELSFMAASTWDPYLGPRPTKPLPAGEVLDGVISTGNDDDQYKTCWGLIKERTECLIWDGKTEHRQLGCFHGALERRNVQEMRQNRGHSLGEKRRKRSHLQLSRWRIGLEQKFPCRWCWVPSPLPKGPN